MEKVREVLIRIFLQEHGEIDLKIERLKEKQYRYKKLLRELGYDIED